MAVTNFLKLSILINVKLLASKSWYSIEMSTECVYGWSLIVKIFPLELSQYN
jgi:hypothetical protein